MKIHQTLYVDGVLKRGSGKARYAANAPLVMVAVAGQKAPWQDQQRVTPSFGVESPSKSKSLRPFPATPSGPKRPLLPLLTCGA